MDAVVIGEGNRLKVLSAGSTRASLIAAARAFSETSGCGFEMAFDTAGGVEKRAASGETPDVFASSMDSLAALRKAGALASAPVAVGSARIALGVRAGEAAPDISTLEKFRQVVKSANRIARGDPSGGGTAAKHLLDAFTRVGLMDDIAARSVLRVGGVNVMKAVADGLADFGITQSTEIAPVPGVVIGGWVPDELQLATMYGVAAGAKAAQAQEAGAFLRWLSSPEGVRHFTDAGFFPA